MRLMFDEFNVVEIIEAEIVPCWNGGNGSAHRNPDFLFVTLYQTGWDLKREDREFYEFTGQYRLDGTKETYQEALANWKEISEKLLVHGYCKATDFKNFEWD